MDCEKLTSQCLCAMMCVCHGVYVCVGVRRSGHVSGLFMSDHPVQSDPLSLTAHTLTNVTRRAAA